MICTKCGATIPEGFKFCGQCGTPVEKKEQEAKPEEKAQEQVQPAGKLVFIRPDGSEGGEHPLLPGENAIGRNHGEIFEGDGYMSPEHGVITVTDGKFKLGESGSLNGVFFKITDEEEIQAGDVFRIGQELIRFDAIPEPQPLEDGTEIMGSPNPGYWGRLTVIVGYGVDGNAHVAQGEKTVLGRERGDILFPEDGYVSGTHLEIVHRDGHYFIKDLESSNGTFLKLRNEREVTPGTYVLMGQQLFRLELV
jgi:predicted component of type VI protein secretion system